MVKDDFSAQRRPGDTIRGPNALEAANLPALDKTKPGAGAIDPCPATAPVRDYRPHAIDVPITYNNAGWTDNAGPHLRRGVARGGGAGGHGGTAALHDPVAQGDCVRLFLTNDLHLDEDPTVPLDHANRLDGSYMMTDETSEISTHVHLVRFDELGSDGTCVGWNYVQAAMPGQTYGYRWFVDQPLRTVFFHDHQYANLHQQKGLFAAMNVEPSDATWTDPATGSRPTAPARWPTSAPRSARTSGSSRSSTPTASRCGGRRQGRTGQPAGEPAPSATTRAATPSTTATSRSRRAPNPGRPASGATPPTSTAPRSGATRPPRCSRPTPVTPWSSGR